METANRGDAEARRLNELTGRIIGAMMDVHKALGPGLLESTYEACAVMALHAAGLKTKRQVSVPVEFMGVTIDAGYRLDLVVEDVVILELKSVERLLPVHEAQLLTYLKLTGLRVGLLVNFNVPLLKDGIKRLVSNFPEPSAPPRLRGEQFERSDRRATTEVLEAIPHREPFLFVDRVLEWGENRLVTERSVRADEPHFAGHYPGAPLMPGVLICEACFQTGAMLLSGFSSRGETPRENAGETPALRRPVLTRILEAKFRGMVRPGDLMRTEVSLEEKMGEAFVMNGRVDVAGKNVLRVKFIVAMVEV